MKPLAPFVIGQVVDYVTPPPAPQPEVEERRRWHVVQIRPTGLAKDDSGAWVSDIALEIGRNGMLAYLPTERYRVRVRKGQKHRESMRQMFPGYMFAKFDPLGHLWGRIPQIDGVVRVICHDCVPVPVPDRIVELVRQIEQGLAKDGGRHKRTYGLAKGVTVRLTDPHAWEGLFGVVASIDAGDRVVTVDVQGLVSVIRLTVAPETLEVIAPKKSK